MHNMHEINITTLSQKNATFMYVHVLLFIIIIISKCMLIQKSDDGVHRSVCFSFENASKLHLSITHDATCKFECSLLPCSKEKWGIFVKMMFVFT